MARNLQSIKTFFALELSQNGKSGSTFSSSVLVAASSELAMESESQQLPSSSCQRLQQTR